MSTARRLMLTLATLVLLLTACADPQTAVGSGDPVLPDDGSELPTGPIPVEPDDGIGDGAGPVDDTPIPVEPDGGIGDSSSPADDAPIPVEPDGGIGDGAGPPDSPGQPPNFGVSSETESLSAPPVTACWSSDGAGLCYDGFIDPTLNPITGDDQLVVTYEPGTLTVNSSPAEGFDMDDPNRERIELTVDQENPGIFLVDTSKLSPGGYVVELFWQGAQGDSFTSVALTVQGS